MALPEAVASYLDADPYALSSAALGERIVALESLVRRAQAAQAEAVRAFDARGGADDDGAASTACWLRDRLGASDRDARRLVGLAKSLDRLPLFAAALRAGEITPVPARVLAGQTRHLSPATVADGEAFLVEWARRLDAIRFAAVVRRWVATVAPAEFERDSERRYDSRWLTLHRTYGGMTSLQGMFEPEGAAVLEAALESLVTANSPDDTRTRDQQRADALVDLVDLARTHDAALAPAVARSTEILVHAPAAAMAGAPGAPPATLADGSPLAPGALDRLGCDGRFRRLLVDSLAVPVELGRATRQVPPALRKYVALRDGGCRYPGCPRGAAYCEAHHAVFWRDGGTTSADNLVLLCRYHHHVVHERHHELELLPDGTVKVTRPDGRVLTGRPRGPTAVPVL
ncbi:MAG TPA: DUF222 domain-containing protein [Frankiaceae bacterium]|nr:DUF222 domain-containing protein [Frankiaceae bacterium]